MRSRSDIIFLIDALRSSDSFTRSGYGSGAAVKA
jgi:hypothetical protein